jgi:hypothetical protein
MEVRRHCGFRDFGDLGAQFRLNRRLYALCWTGTHRPGVLFDRATTWLIAQKVLLPGRYDPGATCGAVAKPHRGTCLEDPHRSGFFGDPI